MQITMRDISGVTMELERRACPLDNQWNDSEARVAPGRQGAAALACRGAGVLQQSTDEQSGRYPLGHAHIPSSRVGYSSQDESLGSIETELSQTYDHMQIPLTLRPTTPPERPIRIHPPESFTATSVRGVDQKSTAFAER